jgi:hypothetical protein
MILINQEIKRYEAKAVNQSYLADVLTLLSGIPHSSHGV